MGVAKLAVIDRNYVRLCESHGLPYALKEFVSDVVANNISEVRIGYLDSNGNPHDMCAFHNSNALG